MSWKIWQCQMRLIFDCFHVDFKEHFYLYTSIDRKQIKGELVQIIQCRKSATLMFKMFQFTSPLSERKPIFPNNTLQANDNSATRNITKPYFVVRINNNAAAMHWPFAEPEITNRRHSFTMPSHHTITI